MLFVNYKIHAPCEDVRAALKNERLISEKEKFSEEGIAPKFHIKEKEKSIRITCELTGGATKDNGFLVGTYFKGRLSEKNGVAVLKGAILTAPIYHLILIILLGFFVYKCIAEGGFSLLPVFLVAFDIIMFWREFKKQSLIKRYIFRAFKNVYADTQNRK